MYKYVHKEVFAQKKKNLKIFSQSIIKNSNVVRKLIFKRFIMSWVIVIIFFSYVCVCVLFCGVFTMVGEKKTADLVIIKKKTTLCSPKYYSFYVNIECNIKVVNINYDFVRTQLSIVE